MRVFGISIGTILLILVAIWIGRKWGSSIPVIKSIG